MYLLMLVCLLCLPASNSSIAVGFHWWITDWAGGIIISRCGRRCHNGWSMLRASLYWFRWCVCASASKLAVDFVSCWWNCIGNCHMCASSSLTLILYWSLHATVLLTYCSLVPCQSQWSVGHRPLVSIQFSLCSCLLLLPAVLETRDGKEPKSLVPFGFWVLFKKIGFGFGLSYVNMRFGFGFGSVVVLHRWNWKRVSMVIICYALAVIVSTS